MREYKTLAKNTFLFSIGQASSTIIGFFMVMVYTRYLTPSEYGLVDIVNTTISLVIPIITLQVSDAVFRFVMDPEADKQKIISTSTLLAIGSTAIFSLISAYIVTKHVPEDIAIMLYLLILFNALNGIQTAFVKGIKRIKIMVAADVLASIVMAVTAIVCLVKLNLGVGGYFIAVLTSWGFKWAFLFFKGGVGKYLTPSVDRELAKKMLGYSIFLVPNMVMWWVVNVSDRYLLAYFLGMDAVGIYAVSYKIPQLLRIPTTIFYQAWQISAVDSYKSQDRDKFYTEVFNVYLALLMISLAFLLPLLKPLSRILFSESFYESWKYAPFLLFGTVFSALASFSGTAYIASKESKGALLTSSIAAFVNAAINVVLIPVWGIYAAAFSTFVAYFTMWIARMKHIQRFVNINMNLKKLAGSLLIEILQMGSLYLSLPSHLFGIVNITAISAIIWLFRIEVKKLLKLSIQLSREIYRCILSQEKQEK